MVQPIVLTSTLTIIDTLQLQFGRVMVCKKQHFFYSDLKPMFIQRRGLPTADQSVACNQVINTEIGFAPSSYQFLGQRKDLQEALKVYFLVVVSLSYWVGVGRSLRTCQRSELVALLWRSELAGSELASREEPACWQQARCRGYELVSHGLAPIHSVRLLLVSSRSQGRNAHFGALHPLWLVSWHVDKFWV